MSHWKVTWPSAPRATTALLARVRPGTKFKVLAVGVGLAAAKARRSPGAPALTATRLTAAAVAVAGMPHRPATGKVRWLLAARAGPPDGPGGLRVSTSRHGGSTK